MQRTLLVLLACFSLSEELESVSLQCTRRSSCENAVVSMLPWGTMMRQCHKARAVQPVLAGLRGGTMGYCPPSASPERRYLNLQLWEASRRGRPELLAAVVKQGAEINAAFETDDARRTALHFAAQNGHLPVVEELVRLGAKLNAVDEQENTALHTAASLGNHDLVEVLLRRGADVEIFNWMGQTAREVGAESGHEKVAQLIERHEHRVLSQDLPAVSLDADQGPAKLQMRKGDWICPECSAHVFKKHDTCFRCDTPKPDRPHRTEEPPMDFVSALGKHMLQEMSGLQKGCTVPRND